jgi:hypothetical protein
LPENGKGSAAKASPFAEMQFVTLVRHFILVGPPGFEPLRMKMTKTVKKIV